MGAQTERITEIAVYIYDDELDKVTDQLVTLINPNRPIPAHITQFTNITNAMVANAPKFQEVARKLVEITSGCIFVAHNARFDYSFIQAEYKSLGYDYIRETLCTVKLSKKVKKGLPSYKLGNLCNYFGITLNNAHRAAADAQATVHLLRKLLPLKAALPPEKEPKPKKATSKLLITNHIPDTCGVYYFYDKEDNPIYIGKSVNIRSRVQDHLNNKTPGKDKQIAVLTKDIKWKETGSELVALLLESDEIKKHQPKFNRAQKMINLPWGLFSSRNPKGYLCLSISKINDTERDAHLHFKNKQAAHAFLVEKTSKYELCQSLNGLYEAADFSCMLHQMNLCQGACQGQEDADKYNARVQSLILKYQFDQPNFMVIEPGRNGDEKSVILVKNGTYVGWNHLSHKDLDRKPNELYSEIKPFEDNEDVRKIILQHLEKKKAFTKVIEL